MKLVTRIFFSFIIVIFLAVLTVAVIGSILLSNAVRSEAFSRVKMGLKDAGLFLEDFQEDLYLTAAIESEGLSEKFNVLEKADILVPLSDPLPEGLKLNSIGNKAGDHGYIMLDRDTVAVLNPEMKGELNDLICRQELILCMYAVHRKGDEIIFAASIINGNVNLAQRLQDMLFENRSYMGKPFGTVTLFCYDTRVATTVIGPGGESALGTTVSEEVRQKVLEEGGTWLDRAFVVDEWYISAYKPIHDPSGNPVGILYVGVLEAYYNGLRKRAITILSSLLVPALGVVLTAAWLITRGITGPVNKLVQATGKIASGRYDICTDIGKKAPGELHALSNAFCIMAKTLRDREDALTMRSRQLEEKNRDYQELLSFLTHELNNSIGSMLLNARLLTDEYVGNISPDQQETAEQILRDIERFRDMVRNYLNLSRMEKGTLPYNPSHINVRTRVLEPVLKRLGSSVEHRNFTIHWDWPDVPVIVQADSDLMDIVFSNLIVNALKYGKNYLLASAQQENDSWIISLTNGGIPIPREKIPELFYKFSRLVKSDDGVGLGLYLVDKIVTRHQGDVWCESGDYGTTFSIRLTAAESV